MKFCVNIFNNMKLSLTKNSNHGQVKVKYVHLSKGLFKKKLEQFLYKGAKRIKGKVS